MKTDRIFIMWIFVVLICFILQSLGNTIIPGIKNYGIIAAILLSLTLLFDDLGKN